MKGELLGLIPKKYLCPTCGKWHKYTWDQSLGYYDSSDYAIEMRCPVFFGIFEVYFANGRCYWNKGDQRYWCEISEFSEIGESRVQMIDSKNNFRLGFEFDILKDKKALKELVAFGGVVSGAYALTRVFDSTDKPEELSVEEIEGKMDSVEEAHQKFAWIQPKAEKLMPVAASVLVVYVLTQKPQWYEKVKDKVVAITGDASAKAGVYIEMAKLFIASKLNIDLDDEAQAKKFKIFALLAAIIGLCAFLYGKGVFNTEEDQSFMEKNPQLKAFIEQAKEIMEKILPTAFSAVTTYMVTKHIIDAKEEESSLEENKENAVETDFTEVKEIIK